MILPGDIWEKVINSKDLIPFPVFVSVDTRFGGSDAGKY